MKLCIISGLWNLPFLKWLFSFVPSHSKIEPNFSSSSARNLFWLENWRGNGYRGNPAVMGKIWPIYAVLPRGRRRLLRYYRGSDSSIVKFTIFCFSVCMHVSVEGYSLCKYGCTETQRQFSQQWTGCAFCHFLFLCPFLTCISFKHVDCFFSLPIVKNWKMRHRQLD